VEEKEPKVELRTVEGLEELTASEADGFMFDFFPCDANQEVGNNEQLMISR
jgi:hypothetical protein